jgi:hypothetical protein
MDDIISRIGTNSRLQDGHDCLVAALDYLALGWSVLPICPPDHVGVGKKHAKDCTSPGKAPVVLWKQFQDTQPTEDDLRANWRYNPTLNVGIALGPVSGLVRIDVDGPGGEQKLQQISGGDLPTTLEFTSGRANGGRGLLYRIPPDAHLKTTRDSGNAKEELRFQAKGSQTVLPPSRHLSGGQYQWKDGQGPHDIDASMAPTWLLKALHQEARHANRQSRSRGDAEKISEGSRNCTLTSLAGVMRQKGFSQTALEAALLAENQERCDPPLSEDEVRAIARSVGRYEPGATPGGTGWSIILRYFKERYEPVFRRGSVLFSGKFGREVKATEAYQGATIQLIEQLGGAEDAPKWADGGIKRADLPRFFSTWAKVAWANLLDELPEEEAASEVNQTAKEEFEARLADALNTIVTLGHEYKQGADAASKVERRSLLDWCVLFAKPGGWKAIRSYRVWAKKEGDRIAVAMRAELFGQLNKPRVTQRQLGDLAGLYGVGTRAKVAGERAIELSVDFLDSQLETFGRSPERNGTPATSAQAKNEGSPYDS